MTIWQIFTIFITAIVSGRISVKKKAFNFRPRVEQQLLSLQEKTEKKQNNWKQKV